MTSLIIIAVKGPILNFHLELEFLGIYVFHDYEHLKFNFTQKIEKLIWE